MNTTNVHTSHFLIANYFIQDEKCRFNKSLVAATVAGQVNITEVKITNEFITTIL